MMDKALMLAGTVFFATIFLTPSSDDAAEEPRPEPVETATIKKMPAVPKKPVDDPWKYEGSEVNFNAGEPMIYTEGDSDGDSGHEGELHHENAVVVSDAPSTRVPKKHKDLNKVGQPRPMV